ncbi:alginate O-acetyltransferase AlgX-related protein [Spirosoma rhododendri]|uniref:AlgX/AlgJ SGNH hydrolase-like domain-containing protein n=1 Tax=Spirosoma rhododendri TaxID=2728024 RepID=A0A7L5DL31_9BACT|nr:hypothetical protein [Spirosoma rhododendri]QJD77883.1 hypothetical protein HH216_05160 [Spirosoma rhododendri]
MTAYPKNDRLDAPRPVFTAGVRRPSLRFRAMLAGCCFAVLLLMPALDQWLHLSVRFQSTEKRALAARPELHFPHVKTFVRDYEQYFNENFGWRNALFYAYSRWKLNILGQSPLPEKVVIGKNGWFYPGNYFAGIVDQHRGISPLQPQELRAINNRLTYYQKQLARQGTKLYVMVVPDSYTMYPEYLPDDIRRADSLSNLDRLSTYLKKKSAVPLIDIRPALGVAKKERPIYCQTDTHWNDFGSLIGSLAMVDRLRLDFPQLTDPCPTDYRISPKPGVGGDLTTMMALHSAYRDSISYAITPTAGLVARQTMNIPNPEMNLPSSRFVGPSPAMPRLLFIGDSFSYSMNQFVPQYFGESFLVRSNRLNMALARAEHADIVVVEIVERNLRKLADL